MSEREKMNFHFTKQYAERYVQFTYHESIPYSQAPFTALSFAAVGLRRQKKISSGMAVFARIFRMHE
jgi:hypothetical protein